MSVVQRKSKKRKKSNDTLAETPESAVVAAIAQSPVVLDPLQQLAVHVVVQLRASLFLTGAAGTGKSLCIGTVVRAARAARLSVQLTATTGRAAANLCESLHEADASDVQPCTLHRFAGLRPNEYDFGTLLRRVMSNYFLRQRLCTTDILIIDEVSMLSPVVFGMLDRLLRDVRGRQDVPFGGVTLLLVGDFYQLPPVMSSALERTMAQGREFCFQATQWREAVSFHLLLQRNFRQGEDPLCAVLSDLRHGRLSQQSEQLLAARTNETLCRRLMTLANVTEDTDEIDVLALRDTVQERGIEMPDDLRVLCSDVEPTKLFARNALVDDENNCKLGELIGEEMVYYSAYHASGRGLSSAAQREAVRSALINGVSVGDAALRLKRGAQVMLVANLTDTLYNGRRAVVEDFCTVEHCLTNGIAISNSLNSVASEQQCALGETADTVDPAPLLQWPLLRFECGQRLLLRPYTWRRRSRQPAYTASLTHLPLKLAWAVSIHKSQGMSISMLHVDLQQVFASGQSYVALSRARSLGGLLLDDFEPHMVIGDSQQPHRAVVKFYEQIENAQARWTEPLLRRFSLCVSRFVDPREM